MMNCIEFRYICITTPDAFDADYLTHQQECHSCAVFARETAKLDHCLHEAVNISPPPELAARILLRQSLSRDKHQHLKYYFSGALAACLLLVISVAFVTLHKQEPTLEQAVVAYVNDNPQSPITGQYVQRNELEHLFTSVGMELDGDLGKVNYAKPCYIRDQISLHLILTGAMGSVTVIVMPDNAVDSTIRVKNTDLDGIIVPCPKGSMAILGNPGEALEAVERRFRNSVTWIGA